MRKSSGRGVEEEKKRSRGGKDERNREAKGISKTIVMF